MRTPYLINFLFAGAGNGARANAAILAAALPDLHVVGGRIVRNGNRIERPDLQLPIHDHHTAAPTPSMPLPEGVELDELARRNEITFIFQIANSAIRNGAKALPPFFVLQEGIRERAGAEDPTMWFWFEMLLTDRYLERGLRMEVVFDHGRNAIEAFVIRGDHLARDSQALTIRERSQLMKEIHVRTHISMQSFEFLYFLAHQEDSMTSRCDRGLENSNKN